VDDIAKNDVAEAATKEKLPAERSVLIVEDDRSFLQRLAKALEQRGFVVATAESVAE
jgi:two-component system response regulator RegA